MHRINRRRIRSLHDAFHSEGQHGKISNIRPLISQVGPGSGRSRAGVHTAGAETRVSPGLSAPPPRHTMPGGQEGGPWGGQWRQQTGRSLRCCCRGGWSSGLGPSWPLLVSFPQPQPCCLRFTGECCGGQTHSVTVGLGRWAHKRRSAFLGEDSLTFSHFSLFQKPGTYSQTSLACIP